MVKKRLQKGNDFRRDAALLARAVSLVQGNMSRAAARSTIAVIARQGPARQVSESFQNLPLTNEEVESTRVELGKFLQSVSAFQEAAKRSGFFVLGGFPTGVDGIPTPALSINLTIRAAPMPMRSARLGGLTLAIDGAPRDLVLAQTLLLLQRVGVDRLRPCECGLLFVKSGRREFCSTRCAKRVYMQNMRAEERSERLKRKGRRR